MPFPEVQDIASDIDAVFVAIALARLVLNGLRRRYPAFTIFLALHISQSLILFHAVSVTQEYTVVWAITSSALWIAQAFASLEICTLTFERHVGSIAERVLVWCLGASLFIAVVFGLVRIPHNPYVPGWFGTVSVVGRALTLGCALAMLGQAALSRLFPASLSRNLTIHRWAFTAYSCIIAFSLVFTTDFNARVGDWANLIMGISTAAISGFWAFSFRTSWEAPAGQSRLPPITVKNSESCRN